MGDEQEIPSSPTAAGDVGEALRSIFPVSDDIRRDLVDLMLILAHYPDTHELPKIKSAVLHRPVA